MNQRQPGEVAAAPARPRMDPRIRERRVAVARDQGRRRLRVLLCAAGVVIAVVSAYGLTRSPLLDVDRIQLFGATHTTAADVVRAGGLADKPQLADIDPLDVVAGVEALPWVHHARVVRHWPAKVEVRVVERAPLATMASAPTGWALVDRTGRVLEVQPSKPSGLAVVVAPPAPAPGRYVTRSAAAGLAVVDALPASLSQLLETVTVAEDDTLVIGFKGVPTVYFGPAEQVRSKLVAVSTLVERANLEGAEAIDVRVPSAPVLTRP